MKKEQRRYVIALIFYIIGIGLAFIEYFIKVLDLDFVIIVGTPIVYPIYYILLSTTIEECKIWPLVALCGIFLLMDLPRETVPSEPNYVICDLLEIILFVIQIVTVIIIKCKDAKHKKVR